MVGVAGGTPVGEQWPAGEHAHVTVSRPLTVCETHNYIKNGRPLPGVADLRGWTDNWIGNRNEYPHPFVWRMTVDEIFGTMAVYLQRILHSGRWAAVEQC